MWKKRMLRSLAGVLAVVLLLGGCTAEPEWSRWRRSFMDTFDTIVELVGYARDAEEFQQYADELHRELLYYNQLFDKYHSYEGMNNIKTINDNAGVAPVQVDPDLVEMLLLCKEWAERTDGAVNVCMGPVLEIWHEYRERYAGSTDGELPPMEELQAAARLTDIDRLIIDEEAGTVFLAEPGMSLDVGAVAKGYATELVCRKLYAQGYTSFAVSSGGNVRLMDAPPVEDRTAWSIGIQDPLNADATVDSVVGNNLSIVTSGDYQRYYMVDGKKVHHIIDSKTLMPADRFISVTVVCEDSGIADLLSTALFILPKEQGEQLAAEEGAEVMWIHPDGTVECTNGLIPLLKERGGATTEPAGA